MKKILFLLLVTVSTYAQVSNGRETKFTNGIRNTASQTATEPINLVTEGADGTYGKVLPANLPTTTATTNALDLKTTISAGAFSGFAVTDNGNGTINVASGIAYLRATNDQYAPIIKYPLSAYNNIPLVDGITNYITVSYNGGSPSLVLNTTGIGIDTQTNSIAIVAARVGTTVHYISLVGSNSDPNAKIRTRYLFTESIKRETGLVISTPASLKIATTAGITYSGLIRLDVPMFNTNTTDTFTQAYQNGGGTWVRTTGLTSINNTQYSNAGTLTTLGTNKYRADFVYTLVNSPSKLYVLLGTVEYNSLSLAQAAPRPSIVPVELQQLGVLVGRVIIKKDDTVLNVASPFAVEFSASVIPDHNDLAGLNTGDFQHLTVAEKAALETTANKSGTLTASSTLYPNNNAVISGLATKQNSLGFTAENVANKSNSFTVSSTTTYANTKALVDGLATKQNVLSNPIIGTGTLNRIPKFTGISSLGNSVISENASGDLGIGTTTPATKLDVNGVLLSSKGTVGDPSISTSSAADGLRFSFNVDSGNLYGFGLTGPISSRYFNWYATGVANGGGHIFINGITERMRLDTDGSLLINTTVNNGRKLRVIGGADIDNLVLTTTPTTSTGSPPVLTRNPTTGVVESVPYSVINNAPLEFNTTDFSVWNNGKGNIISNTAFGDGTLRLNSTSSNMTVFGFNSGYTSISATDGTAFGSYSATQNTTGSRFVAVGNYAGTNNQTSSDWVAIGNDAAKGISDGGNATSIGTSVFLGASTRPLGDSQINQIVIGYGADGAGSNTATLGNTSIDKTVLRGVIQQTTYTVATLPTGTLGMFAVVTDALAPTYLGTLTGGGSVKCPVFFNGTAWVSH